MTTFFIIFWILGIILVGYLCFDELTTYDWKTKWWKPTSALLFSWFTIFVYAYMAKTEKKENTDTKPSIENLECAWIDTDIAFPQTDGIYFVRTIDDAEGIASYVKEENKDVFDVLWATYGSNNGELTVKYWLKYN